MPDKTRPADAQAPARWRPLERGVRRGFELFLLAVSLFAGLAVVGTCGAVSLVTMERQSAYSALGALIALAALLVGVVYLFTSTSRDVRHLTQVIPDLDEPNEPGSNERG